jgi:flagellar hook assembly protein FlgD
LNQNYPNPFNPSTTISYTLPAVASSFSLSQKVHLAVYDIQGRKVETLVNEEQKPGYYKFEWNANHLASGMYIYQLVSKASNSKTNIIRKKMLLLK